VPLQVIAKVLVELVFELLDVPEKENAARSFVTFAASVAHRCSAPQSVKLDNVDQHMIVVNQNDMVPDDYIPMMARRRRKLTAKVRGCGVILPAKVRRDRFPPFQLSFLLGGQAILISKTFGGMALMLGVPIVGDLTVVLVELPVFLG
jgi:hypothetical protein